jgi:hypothetical protein
VAHGCHPSYSGGRKHEDLGSKPAWANSSQDLISKNPSQKRAGGWLKVKVLGSNPSTTKKKKSQLQSSNLEMKKIPVIIVQKEYNKFTSN